ncbi:hypothetical protein KDW_56270 [Dictyobacter vulcani]|uniref:DUF1464 domain-containing protein n=1 Tax=Dictyobacter vulcani TaxID=2607529 RepID=A0A5J4KU84_9CHLR|nr:DUF1464 family protein [Dictyobacter vulcani]GER91465.1 hypothetical protein KDW_56270 [Dictyobacter vulcani]
MAVSIGIEHATNEWRTCLVEDEAVLECRTFAAVTALEEYLQQTCGCYPEVSIALSTPFETAFSSHPHESLAATPLAGFLADLCSLSQRVFVLPSVRHLATVPPYRLLLRPGLGRADMLCIVALLLYRMRKQDAGWSELNFCCLELRAASYRLVVLRNGQIVDGNGEWVALNGPADLQKQALLEQLTRDLAAMLAIHQLEDVVLLSRTEAERKDAVLEYFADRYQFFLFPHSETEPAGFEVARGAAILAHGLSWSGLASEVVQQLFAAAPYAQTLNQHR